jgi:hypothetical protein
MLKLMSQDKAAGGKAIVHEEDRQQRQGEE